MLAACAGHAPTVVNQSREAVRYQARARSNYVPPGPAGDPWGPYITEASNRFDVPERWIREVMHVEWGGNMYQNGRLITSWVGAMGLMQVMPETYDELRTRYDSAMTLTIRTTTSWRARPISGKCTISTARRAS